MAGIAEARLKEERKAWRKDHPVVSVALVRSRRWGLLVRALWYLYAPPFYLSFPAEVRGDFVGE